MKAIMRHAKMDMTLTTAIARKRPSARRSKITRSAFHQNRCGYQNQLRSEKRDSAHHSSKAFEKQTCMSLETSFVEVATSGHSARRVGASSRSMEAQMASGD